MDHENALWGALRQRWSRRGRPSSYAGAIALGVAAAALLVSLGLPWLAVPLFGATGSFALPVDLGWGVRAGIVSYGVVALAAALFLLWRCLQALRLGARGTISARGLVVVGCLAAGITALFVFQFLIADGTLAARLAEQENQSLLIRHNLGYSLNAQRLSFRPFQIPSLTVMDRVTLLFQLAKPGLALPVVAALSCFCGAWFMRDHAGPAPVTARRQRRRLALAVAGVLCALILFGRPTSGLAAFASGKAELSVGDYRAALQRFDLAAALAPSLAARLDFHQQRGDALWHLGQTGLRDAGLYQTAQLRALGAFDQATVADQTLLARYPGDAFVTQDFALTLETSITRDLNDGLNFRDAQRVADFPLDSLQRVAQVLPSLEQDLPQLDQLVALQPGNLYAHFLRGRILLITRSYGRAAPDFAATIALTHDRDMQSAGDTYLAFCLGGQGDFAGERRLLKAAMELDDGYNNTTAREAASGLH